MVHASIRPSQMSEGGRLDNTNAEITSAEFGMYDWEGKADASPCLILHLRDVESGEDIERPQYYGCGSADNWRPSDDGEYLDPVGNAKMVSKRSNFGFFMQKLLEAGFDEDAMPEDGNIKFLEGLVLHFEELPTGSRKQDGSPRTCPVPTAVVEDGSEGKKPQKGKAGAKAKAEPKAKGKAGAKAKAEPEPDEDEGDDGDVRYEDVEAEVMEILAGAGGSAAKKILGTKLFGLKERSKEWRGEAFKLVTSDEWLGDDERPWAYENGIVSVE